MKKQRVFKREGESTVQGRFPEASPKETDGGRLGGLHGLALPGRTLGRSKRWTQQGRPGMLKHTLLLFGKTG